LALRLALPVHRKAATAGFNVNICQRPRRRLLGVADTESLLRFCGPSCFDDRRRERNADCFDRERKRETARLKKRIQI
jgi:hypothetical protein